MSDRSSCAGRRQRLRSRARRNRVKRAEDKRVDALQTSTANPELGRSVLAECNRTHACGSAACWCSQGRSRAFRAVPCRRLVALSPRLGFLAMNEPFGTNQLLPKIPAPEYRVLDVGTSCGAISSGLTCKLAESRVLLANGPFREGTSSKPYPSHTSKAAAARRAGHNHGEKLFMARQSRSAPSCATSNSLLPAREQIRETPTPVCLAILECCALQACTLLFGIAAEKDSHMGVPWTQAGTSLGRGG